MSIVGQPGEVARVGAAFAEFATARGLPTDLQRSLQVVLDELLANIVSYAIAGQAGGEARVDIAHATDALVITVSDNGPPFDPFGRAEPDTTLSVKDRPIGGLGIHLVRKLVDEVRYSRRGDRNVTVLTKRLTHGSSRSHGRGE
jgi:anti-sigma regulatory factor (Ser/Thr protein kinase)